MPTSALTKFYSFTENLGKGRIDFSTHAFRVALTNSAPALTYTVLASITQIAATGGYAAGGYLLAGVTWAMASGVSKLAITDEIITAAGGSVGPFRYLVLYDDTDPNDILIGWYDHGSAITLLDTETYLLDFDGSNGVWEIT